MKAKVALIIALISYGNIWSGSNKLDLWHESDMQITKEFGVGTEFIYDLYNRPSDVGYGYLFAYYQVSPNIRVAIGQDYKGNPVSQFKYSVNIGKVK